MTDSKISEMAEYINNQNTVLKGVATWDSYDLPLS